MFVFVRENFDIYFDNFLWDYFRMKEKLRCLYGIIKNSSDWFSMVIIFKNSYGEFIRISKIRGINRGFDFEEEVLFYLGFSIVGLIVYNVKLKCYEGFNFEKFIYSD